MADGPEVGGGGVAQARTIRLRYPGVCETCGTHLAAGTRAFYDPVRRRTRCIACPPASGAAGPAETERKTNEVGGRLDIRDPDSGVPGASARREYERRSRRYREQAQAAVDRDARRRRQIKDEHPVLGRVAAAIIPAPTAGPEPQGIAAWDTGADGEERVGQRLQRWASDTGNYVLHDRRIPRSRANIDHIALAASGVWVIDTKEYKGLVQGVNVGGLLHPDLRLRVAGRDRTRLAAGVYRQMLVVAEALDRIAGGRPRPTVHGVLCFTGAEWSLFARPFVVEGVTVSWPAATVDLLHTPGAWDSLQLRAFTASLGQALPSA